MSKCKYFNFSIYKLHREITQYVILATKKWGKSVNPYQKPKFDVLTHKTEC